MSEQNGDDIMNPTQFKLGYDNATNPDVMVFSIPLKWCAEDVEFGTALLKERIDGVKSIALGIIRQKREMKQKANGIIKPLGPDLNVA